MNSEESGIPSKEDLLKSYSSDVKKKKSKYFHDIKLLWNDKKFNEIVELGEKAIAELPDKPTGDGDRDISGIYLLYATALWELGKNQEEALAYAIKAAHFDRTSQNAMWLLREINNDYSDDAKLWRIDVTGQYYIPVGNGVSLEPFTTTYQVVASDEKEALEYIHRFERPEIARSIELKESKIKKENAEDPKGVYTTATLFAYNLSKDE